MTSDLWALVATIALDMVQLGAASIVSLSEAKDVSIDDCAKTHHRH